MLLNWYRSPKKPKDWRVPSVSLQGQPFEAYVSSDVLGDLQKIAVEQTCSPVAVFRESLMHRFEEPEPEEKVMAEGLILDTFAQELGRYARAKGANAADKTMTNKNMAESRVTVSLRNACTRACRQMATTGFGLVSRAVVSFCIMLANPQNSRSRFEFGCFRPARPSLKISATG